eukprot:8071240-Pyramimonas_sp.AAC.1
MPRDIASIASIIACDWRDERRLLRHRLCLCDTTSTVGEVRAALQTIEARGLGVRCSPLRSGSRRPLPPPLVC